MTEPRITLKDLLRELAAIETSDNLPTSRELQRQIRATVEEFDTFEALQLLVMLTGEVMHLESRVAVLENSAAGQ